MLALVLLGAAVTAERAAGEVSPVEKVMALLRGLESQVQSEGAAEKETYNKMACFCQDKQLEKDALIKSKTSDQGSLEADLEQLTALKDTLTGAIAKANKDLDEEEAALQQGTEIREKEHANYVVVHTDTVAAVNGVKDAKAALAASKGSLIQVKKLVESTEIQTLLQLAGKEPDYDFHADGIIEVLDGLESQWTEKQQALEDEENAAKTAFDDASSAMRNRINAAKSTISSKSTELATTEESIALKSSELVETKATKHDAETYLKDLTGQCERKAREWDQRSTLRSNELAALSKALEIMGDVETSSEASGSGGRAHKVVMDLQVEEDAEDPEEYSDVVFVQREVRKVHVDRKDPLTPRNKAISQLKAKAVRLRSSELAMLAMKIASDPFAKVKTLIQQLIERLMKESTSEATHKGWCDTELGKATQDRDFRNHDIRKASANLQMLEAQKGTLKQTITDATAEIADLNGALTESSELRAAEKAENKATLEAAGQGLTALKKAIEVLETFYRKSSRATMSLAQHKAKASPVDADLASEGVGHLGAYQGNQAASEGILGMLATIKSDFERTVKETTSAEEQASRDFAGFSKETKASIAANTKALKNAEGELKITSGDLVQAYNDLKETQKLLDSSLEQLEVLRTSCIDTDESFEDKTKRRQDEIDALKQCLQVFDEGLPSELGFLQTHA
jgi:hypothetical protein